MDLQVGVKNAVDGSPSVLRDCGGPHVRQAHFAGSAIKIEARKRRDLVRQMRQEYQLSENRACSLMRITHWSNRYQSRRDAQTELRIRLRDLAGTRIRYGYRSACGSLRAVAVTPAARSIPILPSAVSSCKTLAVTLPSLLAPFHLGKA